MSSSSRPGYYRDQHGNWQKERRQNPDRRRGNTEDHFGYERRRVLRRKSDLEALEQEHREMVEEALKDFASHH